MPTLPDEDLVRLWHMLEAARKAQEMAGGRDRENLDTDEQLSLALQRLIEIVGEAATKVSAETCSQTDDIPWKQIRGMRNRLIHAYFDVNLDILWNTVTEDLPPLVSALESLLGSEG